ncbi:RidA/YER057c/UK114 superfamily protein [hydrothermal vent metagenome]|uniref:RidA/YER057c/UK114 superfamily protein n=1 Tax=hydrothermal vent metagenome TaxID=652676 RepID=A0A3B1CC60_9ZZZZ
MNKKVIKTDKAPSALGPYSQAIVAGGMVYTAGQIGIDPATGKLAGNDIEVQARQVMKNLEAVLASAGGSFTDVVKSTVYLADLNDFAKVNDIYQEKFVDNPPARSTVQVSALPLGALVEIDMIAALPGGS